MDMKSLRRSRLQERAGVSSVAEEKEIVVQQWCKCGDSTPNQNGICDTCAMIDEMNANMSKSNIVDKMAQAIVREHNRHEVQILAIEKYQWYGAELAKALAMHENRWMVDWIFEHSQQKNYAPFIVRPIRLVPEGEKLVFRRPTVRPSNPRAKLLEWFIPWHHNIETPGFITYSSLPFYHSGYWHRLIDIDFGTGSEEDQMHNYCDHSEYKHYYDLLCAANLSAVKMEKSDVRGFQTLLKKASKSIKQTIKSLACDPFFTGGGFRLLVRAQENDELTDNIDDWKANKLICPSSTMGYQAQKLFSIQTMKEHFQTEVDPNSRWFDYSNPAFSVVMYPEDGELLSHLFAYYKTWQRGTYILDPANRPSDRDIYTTMTEEQKCLEEKIIKCL